MNLRFFVVLSSVLLASVALRAGDLAGRWEGRPKLPDGSEMKIAFVFAVSGEAWTAAVVTEEFGSFPGNDVVVDGDTISFNVPTDGGTYYHTATLKPEGLLVEGRGPDGPFDPVVYRRPAAGLVGKWRGKLDTPNGPADVVYTFESRDGKLTGTVSSQLGEAPLTNISVDGTRVAFASTYGGFTVQRRGTVTGDTMQLTITIDGNDLAATFTREAAAKAGN